jgi:hypothetical protein
MKGRKVYVWVVSVIGGESGIFPEQVELYLPSNEILESGRKLEDQNVRNRVMLRAVLVDE